ncbi:glycohydrolase toxin TNT-related protein [Gillisia sp. JM1]|uniref:glycohydrolase toxin TNT-related protein n=1 Tax=Gillisia sp. JM1 TaxID=1283286 RepID=UPI000402E5DA|nr:glycohydrolase toxin TNT-related protein [Gillisia sp. JM1]
MGIFDKLFGKKESKAENESVQLNKGETFVAVDNESIFRIIRSLTDEQKEGIEKSTILLRTSDLYMHYWTTNLICEDRNDPAWRNKVMFFWRAEEPFPKKSLPPEFETFEIKHFLFNDDTSKISLQVAQAAPWFGMPGLGEKHFCEMNSQKVTIPELNELGIVDYFDQIELTNENLNILTSREEYFFLVDERITPFQNGNFYLKDKIIPISVAYEIGGIHIVKKTKLE